MTLSPSNPRAKGRWLFLGALVATLMLTMAAITLAVHELAFQLDGETTEVGYSLPGAQTVDWDSLFNADGSNTSVINPVTGPFTNADFVRDFESKAGRNGTCSLTSTGTTFCTGDSSTFATGSKDTLNINPGWQCNRDNNVNSKIDIMNAYAAAYIVPSGPDAGHRLMYFGLEKNKDNGTNNVGFWFLQGSANCASSGPAANWSGTHTNGDVLVVSEFTSGGGVSSIFAYQWVGGADGFLDPDPIGSGGDCKTATPPDAICATTNSGANDWNDPVTTKWLTSDATLGVGHTVVSPDFFEGGIDLTQVFEDAGGSAPSCFNTFIGDTRSSVAPTATLFDYARGVLGQCSTTLRTSAAGTANGSIGTGVVSSGTDTATLTITGTPTWGGTMTWYLCGPVAADGCDKTQGVLVTSRPVSNTSLAADFVSDTANLTSVGRYCWTAHFEPNQATLDAGVSAADDNGVGECFSVAPVTPTLTTQASCSATPCVLGSTLSDKAFLTGTASQPGTGGPSTTYPSINPSVAGAGAPAGGTISWVLYAPSNGGCTDTRITLPATATVSGDNTTTGYGPTSYTTLGTDPIGTYTFVANYAGNTPNTNAAATVTCAAPGANETVTVSGTVSSATQQRWLPNDRIVLTTNGGTLDGTLTATLYRGTFGGTAANCTAGTAVAVTGQSYTFDTSPLGVPDASGTVYQTSNSTFFVGTNPNGTAGGANGNYFWLIHYDDANLTDPADRCETTSITVTD